MFCWQTIFVAADSCMIFYIYQRCKKSWTAKNRGQEEMQNKGTLCPSFVHYFTPGGPIETDEVTLHSVLFLGLYMCRECFQGVSLSYLLNEKLSGTSLPNINTSPPIGMSQRALQYIKSEHSGPHELPGHVCNPIF